MAATATATTAAAAATSAKLAAAWGYINHELAQAVVADLGALGSRSNGLSRR